jgi:segregation and condensation protein B
MKALIEGLLFIKGSDGLSLDELNDITGYEKNDIKKVLKELYDDMSSDDRGIQLELLGNKYKLTTKEKHNEIYQKLTLEEETGILSQAAIETLAIIAYNEPITRIEIDEIRGVNSSYLVRKLLLKNLIQEVGRSELAGHPRQYGVTNDFLDYFGLNSIEDLPPLKDVEPVIKQEEDLYDSKYKEEDITL